MVELAGVVRGVVVAVDVVLDELGAFLKSAVQPVIGYFSGHFRHSPARSRVEGRAEFMWGGLQVDGTVGDVKSHVRPVKIHIRPV